MYETPNSLLASARELGLPQDRFRQTPPGRYAEIVDRVLSTFVVDGPDRRRLVWLWEQLKRPTHSSMRGPAYKLLQTLVDPTTRIWLLTEDWGRTKRDGCFWVFEGDVAAIADVLDNMHALEYYLVSRNIDWMLLENHHDVVVGAGEWIVEKLTALCGTGGLERASALHFRTLDLKTMETSERRSDLAHFLQGQNARFRNGIHACVRLYTCRASLETPCFVDLHWNGTIEDERQIGSIGWVADRSTIRAVENELRAGRAVRLFGFNSDADLIFEEQLVPETS
jgi:hypothetical protein